MRYFVYIISLCLVSCAIQSTKLHDNPDPFRDSFYNKNLKLYIGKGKNQSSYDTIEFDSTGNIARRSRSGIVEYFSYNAHHYPVHILVLNDAPSNFVITYGEEGNLLLEYWFEVKHFNWDIDMIRDLDSKPDLVLKHSLDKNGLVVETLDGLRKRRILYKYNPKKRLTDRFIQSTENGELLEHWKYLYSEDRQLNSIQMWREKKLILSHHFSNGLLDSTVYSNDVIKYRHLAR